MHRWSYISWPGCTACCSANYNWANAARDLVIPIVCSRPKADVDSAHSLYRSHPLVDLPQSIAGDWRGELHRLLSVMPQLLGKAQHTAGFKEAPRLTDLMEANFVIRHRWTILQVHILRQVD